MSHRKIERVLFIAVNGKSRTLVLDNLKKQTGVKACAEIYSNNVCEYKGSDYIDIQICVTPHRSEISELSESMYSGIEHFCLFVDTSIKNTAEIDKYINSIRSKNSAVKITVVEAGYMVTSYTPEIDKIKNYATSNSLMYHCINLSLINIVADFSLQKHLTTQAIKIVLNRQVNELCEFTKGDELSHTTNNQIEISENKAAVSIVEILRTVALKETLIEMQSELLSKKEDLKQQLKILQKTSYTKSFQNALSTLVACVTCLLGVGAVAMYLNYRDRGNPFLFWTEGPKQKAEVAINMVERNVSAAIK